MSDSHSIPSVPIHQSRGGLEVYNDGGELQESAAGPSTWHFESSVGDTAIVPLSQSAPPLLDSAADSDFHNPMMGDFARTFDFLQNIRKSLADKGAAPNRNIEPYELALVVRVVSGGIIDPSILNCFQGLRKCFASAIPLYLLTSFVVTTEQSGLIGSNQGHQPNSDSLPVVLQKRRRRDSSRDSLPQMKRARPNTREDCQWLLGNVFNANLPQLFRRELMVSRLEEETPKSQAFPLRRTFRDLCGRMPIYSVSRYYLLDI